MDKESMPRTNDEINLKEFILLFENLPELWDASNTDYINKLKRLQSYEKLLSIYQKIKPQATLEDVRKKINSLRSNFRKELKKVEESKRSGVDHVYKPKSWVFHALHFLQPCEKTEGSNNLSMLEVLLQDERENSQEHELETFEPHRKLIKTESIEKQREILEKNCVLHSKIQPTATRHRVRDPQLNATALYWVEKLEKLDRTQRLYAEKAINDVLFEAQLGTLTRDSVQINRSSAASDEYTTVYVPIVSPKYTDSVNEDADSQSPVQSTSPYSFDVSEKE